MTQDNLSRIVDALGGVANIRTVEPCVTRMRFELADPSLVSLDALRPPLCFGATLVGTACQVIVGPRAEILTDELRERFGER
ncbi:PTS transporter subunit EIIB [Nanchangia anserum]|uniref:PTS transporter subunit EIIB n=1 Tax=Nanchangia anserum TaxID=2692125 RepID=A0A8I0GBF3_9ACTO|nr:PTS transporter subunit EIIB [Nanchangia anserum]MBD3689698.1 PTS transporter subunit EIIB [Nanchangia anserum]QOX81873.1 PTS transporter subunit EIIB [Nanchangia anserum]